MHHEKNKFFIYNFLFWFNADIIKKYSMDIFKENKI